MPAFSAPWALAAAGLAVWLLWQARRSQSRRTHTVANLFLWRDSRAAAPSAEDSDRPRPPWIVWVQALALVTLAVAAAGPVIGSAESDTALIIDLSPSLGAREREGARIDLARTAAREWISARPDGARIALITAGRRAVHTGTYRANDAALDAAIAAMRPDTSVSDLAGAVSAARRVTTGPLAVVSDAPSPIRIEGPAIEWLQVGSALDNIAITSLRSGGPGRALVEVQNLGLSAQPVSVSLERSGTERTEIWRQSFTLNAGTTRAFLPSVPAGTTAVTARVTAENPAADKLDSDNARSADVSAPPHVGVLLVTTGNRFLEQALRALPDVSLTIAAALPSLLPAGTRVVVCDGCATAAAAPSLWLPAPSGSRPPDADIAVTRPDHALLRGIDFSATRAAARSASAGSMAVLATADGRPLIAADESSGGRQVMLAADLSQSSLPLTVAFPIFIANAVNWLADRAPAGLDAAAMAEIAESNLREPRPASLDAVPAIAGTQTRSLLAAVVTLALIVVLFELAWRRRQPLARAVAVVAIGGVIFGARMPGCASGRTVMFALDGSGSVASVRQAALSRVRTELSAMSAKDRAGLMVFGERGERLRDPDNSRTLDAVTLPPPSAVTNIAAGLRSAVQLLPTDGDRRIVLLSDGQPTTGDAMEAAADLRVPVDVIPLDDRNTAVIRRLDAPVEARSGAPISLRAEIEGAPGTRVAVDLVRDGTAIATRQISIGAGGHAAATWTDTPPRSGVVFYHAAVMDPRLGIAMSETGAGVTVEGRSRMLIATDRPGEVWARLTGQEREIDERRPEAMPESRNGLADFSAIVLDAIAPHRFNSRQLDAISDAVALDGAGLLVLGDRESLGISEFAPSRFTDSLPVDFTTLPRPPKATMALALLVDTSGSMATASDGVTKISAATAAVTRALAVIPAGDAVQVIGFSATPTVIVPAGDPRDAASVAGRLRAMVPNGGTALTPALTHAMTWLRGESNPVRRILLVSDGRTTPADAASALSAVSGQGIEVSVVAIGSDADRNWLSAVARSTGGRAYFPDSLRSLPRDVAREAGRGANGREIDERFRVRPGAHPLAPASPPELGGYVAGKLRPGATAAWKSSTEDPVLAAWPHGLGRVAVFASDLRGPWGAPLAAWRDSAAFWRRSVTWLSRATNAANVDAQLETTSNGTRLIVDTGIYEPGRTGPHPASDALPSIFATLLTPSGATILVSLHAVTSTRAEASVPLDETGGYRATIVISDPQGGPGTRFVRGWFWNGDLEAQARSVNLPVLQEIANRSGGVMHAAGTAAEPGHGVFHGPRTGTSRDASLPLLLAAAALLFWDYSRALAQKAPR